MNAATTAPAAAPVSAADDIEVRRDAALAVIEDDDAPAPRPRYRHFTLSDGSVGYEPIEG